jgi:NADPH:quinone reductase-like Zn-dependent oxidoreductase
MRALRFHRFGPPAEVLRIDDLPTPEPGPGEVRVRLTHRSINPADLHTVRGRYGRLPALPAVGGNEGVGVVDALGAGVEGLAEGQRVVPLAAGPTWQESLLARPDDLLPVPDAVPDAAAAQLFVNPLTAWLLLAAAPALRPGDTVAQTAGASAVGRLVTQLAARRGLRVVSLVRSGEHAEALRALGAGVVVTGDVDTGDREVTEAARRAVAAAVGDAGARAAFDGVAGAAGGLLAGALADGGTLVVYGALSGKPVPVPTGALIYRAAVVRGVWRTRWFAEAPRAGSRAALEALMAEVAAGALALPVEATYDLADAAAAVAHAEARGRLGKVLLTG